MKVTVFFLCLALVVVFGNGYDIEEELEEYMLEDMLDGNDFDLGDVQAQNKFTNALKKVRKIGKKAGKGIKKKRGQEGCDVVNRLPSKELAYRMSFAFPELISEDGFYETADVMKLANDVRRACGDIGD